MRSRIERLRSLDRSQLFQTGQLLGGMVEIGDASISVVISHGSTLRIILGIIECM